MVVKPTNYLNLKVFGCTTYAHVRQDKLQPKALKCIFIGYPKEVKGYNLWCLESSQKNIIISCDVVFNEEEFPCLKSDGAFYQDDSICQDYNVGVKVELTYLESWKVIGVGSST